jgi:hypothetical protein
LVEGLREGNLVHYRPRPDALRAVLPHLHELAGS